MSSIKKNLVWNFILTISGYLFPLLTFPYVTRVLGAGNLGSANFALSIVDYAILFSTFGLGTIGYRFIPQCNDNVEKRNHVFSHLVSLHILMSALVLLLYIFSIFFIDQLRDHYVLYLIGICKIIANIFLVEWLFTGMQDFRYVTLRTIVIRCLYVGCIFLFIRDEHDYDNYFYVTIGQVVFNALINWRYSRKFVTFTFEIKGIREYIFPVFSMGINRILLSFYGTFNVIFLGFICSNAAVGYYTTATKLYAIFLSVLNAYNGVFVPRLNYLLGKGDINTFKKMINSSLSIVTLVSIPVVIVGLCLADDIIRIIAGPGYERSVIPFQIVLVQVLMVGLAQIFENQILLSMKKFKDVLICTSVCTVLSVFIILLFVPTYAEVAAACAVAIPHLIECIILYKFAKRAMNFIFPYKTVLINFLICIPIAVLCLFSKHYYDSSATILCISIPFSFVYYLLVQLFFLKNQLLISQFNSLKIKFRI